MELGELIVRKLGMSILRGRVNNVKKGVWRMSVRKMSGMFMSCMTRMFKNGMSGNRFVKKLKIRYKERLRKMVCNVGVRNMQTFKFEYFSVHSL